jgi:hypothetical protein
MSEDSGALLKKTSSAVWAYCRSAGWRGYDPYDGLNSPLIKNTPLGGSRLIRMAATQAIKRSPINLRPLLGVKPGVNAKALALLLSSATRLSWLMGAEEQGARLRELADLLAGQSLTGYSGPCWGYNFDWQSRAFFAPAGTPNIVTTVYAAQAFLDAFDVLASDTYLATARDACRFILDDLPRTDSGAGSCFSYTPLDRGQVHNANLLAAALLARVYSYTGEQELLAGARRAARFSVDCQNEDGSWRYGSAANQSWIDSFHTGFNLVALADYALYTGETSFNHSLASGLAFYRERFFRPDAAPKYYADRVWPLDIHSAAQAIITLSRMGMAEDAVRVARWTIDQMYDERGYFYFQINRLYKNTTPYLRWSQAHMLNAMTNLIETTDPAAAASGTGELSYA